MKKVIALGAVSLVLVACGGSDYILDQGSGIEGSGGSGGDDATSTTASSDQTGSGGENSTTTSGTSGTGGSDSSTTVSSTSTGETTSTTGTGCVPKTCVTVAVEMGIDTDQICGPVSDGCGNYIDCGGCDGNFEECGGAPPYVEKGDVIYPEGTENVCGGGCIINPHQPAGCDPGTGQFICNTYSLNGPKNDCYPFNKLSADGSASIWCCD